MVKNFFATKQSYSPKNKNFFPKKHLPTLRAPFFLGSNCTLNSEFGLWLTVSKSKKNPIWEIFRWLDCKFRKFLDSVKPSVKSFMNSNSFMKDFRPRYPVRGCVFFGGKATNEKFYSYPQRKNIGPPYCTSPHFFLAPWNKCTYMGGHQRCPTGNTQPKASSPQGEGTKGLYGGVTPSPPPNWPTVAIFWGPSGSQGGFNPRLPGFFWKNTFQKKPQPNDQEKGFCSQNKHLRNFCPSRWLHDFQKVKQNIDPQKMPTLFYF